MSDTERAEVDEDLGEAIYSSDSRDSVQPVVRFPSRLRIVTQDEPLFNPGGDNADSSSIDEVESVGSADQGRDSDSQLSEEIFDHMLDDNVPAVLRATNRRRRIVAQNAAPGNPSGDDAADGSSVDEVESVGSADQGGSSDDMQFIDRLIFEVRVARALNEMVEPRYNHEDDAEPSVNQEGQEGGSVEEDSNNIQAVPVPDQIPQEEPQPPLEAPAERNLEEAAARPSPPRISRRSQAQEPVVISLDSPSPPKKRKRVSSANTSLKKSPENKPPANLDDEDDGLTCPICLDSWEMSGDHRLVSLRCGHLFGESCIRRWLNESQRQSSVKVCPQCKTKAAFRDIRHLYAKRIQMVDTEIREQLETERRRTQTLTTELATAKLAHTLTAEKLSALQRDYDRIKELLRAGGSRGAFSGEGGGSASQVGINQLASHRLYMEKNFEITREPGCRVLLYSAKHSILVASQKSAQNLFPGYGVRFIDPPTFRPLHFLHTSALLVRDIGFSESQHMLTVASREPKIKLFDIRTRLCSSMFTAHDKMLWSCALDRNEREHFLYGGDLRGGVYIYDTRFPETILSEFQAEGKS